MVQIDKLLGKTLLHKHKAVDIPAIITAREITKEPTGFTTPESVVMNYDETTRKITLTGTFEAYWRGEKITELVTGWASTAHPENPVLPEFLYYNGTNFVWSTNSWMFDYLQIAIVVFSPSGTFLFAQRECHGFMEHDCHAEFHYVVGTLKESGGTLSGYTLNSNTATNRRPQISETVVRDEDVPTTLPALTTNAYSILSLTGTGVASIATSQSEMVLLTDDQPYYNLFSGGTWSQATVSVGNYMTMWLVAIPVTSDTNSQKLRYLWIQGQSQGSLSAQQGLSPNNLNLGNFTNLTPEFVFISKVIVRYIGGNWSLIEVNNISGTRFSQVSSPAGNYLSTVSHDATLTGSGTVIDPLAVDTSGIKYIQSGTSDPSSPLANQVFLNTTTGILKIYFDGVWQTLHQVYFVPDAPVISTVNGDSSPAEDSDTTPEVYITGIASGDLVKVYDGTTEVASGTASTTTITLTTSALSAAEHSLTAKVTRNGLTSESSNTFVYTVTAATIAVFSDFVKVDGSDATEEDGVITFPDGLFSAYTDVNYSDNAYCQFTVETYPSMEFCVSFRDSVGTHIYGYNCDNINAYNPNVTNVYIGKMVNHSQSWDTNIPWTVTSGDVLRFEISGDTITVKQNGTTLLTDTANFETGSYWGITTQSSGVISGFEFGQL
jgi:hypothetical protein